MKRFNRFSSFFFHLFAHFKNIFSSLLSDGKVKDCFKVSCIPKLLLFHPEKTQRKVRQND